MDTNTIERHAMKLAERLDTDLIALFESATTDQLIELMLELPSLFQSPLMNVLDRRDTEEWYEGDDDNATDFDFE